MNIEPRVEVGTLFSFIFRLYLVIIFIVRTQITGSITKS